MRKLSKLIDIALYIIVAIILLAAITSVIWKKPVMFSSVRSNSMYPLFRRGDMLLIKNISSRDTIDIGDIIVFKAEEGSLADSGWIVHRIVDGNQSLGFITKGDANEYADQTPGGPDLVKREWIAGRVLTIGDKVLKIPLIGYLPLWMEALQKSSYTMPIITVGLAGLVGISELMGSKKKKKENPLSLQLIYFFGGLTLSVIMAATMLTSSERVVVPYEVSEDSIGVLMGSSVGIIKVGDKIEQPLSDLNNNGFIPIISTITTKDTQINFSHTLEILKPGTELETYMILNASNPGKYESVIYIGLFYPFLPSKLIYALANISYWLALAVISLIPGLPLMLYPLIDSKLRRKTIKEIRRLTRRMKLSFFHNDEIIRN